MLQFEAIAQGPMSVIFYLPTPKISCLGQQLVLSPGESSIYTSFSMASLRISLPVTARPKNGISTLVK